MNDYLVGIVVGIVGGVMLTGVLYIHSINSECKEFGKSYTSKYDLECTKREVN